MTGIKRQHLTLPKALLYGAGIAIASLIFYNSKDMIFGAPLRVDTIADGTTLEDAFLPIRGIAGHARELAINGRSVALDRKGNFDDSVLLSPGYNVVEVALKDQFGNRNVKTYHLVVQESATVAAAPSEQYQQ